MTRERSLEFALQFFSNREPSSGDEVIELAQKFYDYVIPDTPTAQYFIPAATKYVRPMPWFPEVSSS